MKKLSNISLKEFRDVLKALGLVMERTSGGHEIWSKEGLTRPITFQSHINPVPEMVVKNTIRDLDMTREQFIEALENL